MGEYQIVGLLWGVGALALVLSSLSARKLNLGQTMRYALLWVGLFAFGYGLFRMLGMS